jgi:hypothetical protein
MTPDDVIGEFMRSATSVEGGADMHYLDVSSMAAEIVRLRATVERVRGCERYFEGPYYHERCIGGDWMRAADILAALEGTDEAR